MITLKDLIDLGNITLGNGTKINFTQSKQYSLILEVDDGKEHFFWTEKDDKLCYDGHGFEVADIDEDIEVIE